MNALVLPREVADILHGFAEIKDFGQALRGKHLHEAVFPQLNDVGLGAAHIRRWIENLIVERLVFFPAARKTFAPGRVARPVRDRLHETKIFVGPHQTRMQAHRLQKREHFR